MCDNLDKIATIKKFNSIFLDLLNQVSPLIGTRYLIGFKRLIKINSIMPIQNFVLHAIPHENKINERNPEYFMNENIYKSEVEKNNEFT